MFAFYKARGISLIEKLNEIYDKFGYCYNALHSYQFNGSSGMERMAHIMGRFRAGIDNIAGWMVQKTLDYNNGLDGLPPANVLKYVTEFGSVVVRPSGTEPKLKVYISVSSNHPMEAVKIEGVVHAAMSELMN